MQFVSLKPQAPKSLDELFAGDDLGLFADIKIPKKNTVSSPLENKFLEIVAFVEKYQREPSNKGELNEKSLARRL